MKMNFKILVLLSLYSSITMQASSLTTLLQYTVPIISGITGYKSYQDANDFRALSKSYRDLGDYKLLKGSGSSEISYQFALISLAMAGSSIWYSNNNINLEKDIASHHAIISTGLAILTVGTYIYGHKKLELAKKV